MTQVYDNGTGAREFSSNIPTAKTTPTVEGTINSAVDRVVTVRFTEIANTSGDSILRFDAPDKGKIKAVRLVNGSVACDGSNGLELSFINKTNSDDVVAYVGFGSGTEATKATDKDTAVSAYETSTVVVTDTSRFNKGDNIECTIDRDGTTVVGTIDVILEIASTGR